MDSSDMKRYLKMLKSLSFEERETAINSLTDYGMEKPEEVLKEIHKLIKKGNETQKQAAYEIVGHVQNESSLPILLKKLTDKDPTIREHASNAIIKFEQPPKSFISDLFLIVRKERNDRPHITLQIYRILGEFKNLRAVPVLLEDSSSDERDAAIQEIVNRHGKDKVEIFWTETTEMLDEAPEELFNDSDFMGALLEGINSTNKKIRINSLHLFCKNADEYQFNLIKSKLKDPSPEIRKMVLKWLANFEKKESGKALVNSLGDAEVHSTASKLLEDTRWLEHLVSVGLKSENSMIRGNSAVILTKLGEKSVVNDIIEALNTEEVDETKSIFVKALGDLEDRRAIPSLLDLTFSPNEKIVQNTRDSLTKIGKISGLTEFLYSIEKLSKIKNIDEVIKIKEKIQKIGEVPPAELICQLIKSSEIEELRAAAAQIAGWGEIHETVDYLRDAIKKDTSSLVRTKACEAIAFAEEEAIETLISFLPDTDDNVRIAASRSLVKINRPLQYVESLFNPEDKIRLGIAEVLQELRSPEALNSLREAIKKEQERSETDQAILNAFILALGSPRDPSTIDYILPFLENPMTSTRVAAVQALGEISDNTSIVPLLRVLDDTENDVQEKALAALKFIGKHSEALNFVITALQTLRNPDGFKKTETIETLVTRRDLSLPLLHQALDQPLENLNLRRGVLAVLGEIVNPESIEYFYSALADNDPIIRGTIAQAISKYDPDRTSNRLIPLLDSSTESIRWGVAEALAIIAKEETRHSIENRLVPYTEVSNNVRKALCHALGVIGNQDSASCLIEVLSDTEPFVRIETARSLGLISNPIALIPLFEKEEDLDQEVREATTEALDQLSEACNTTIIVENFRKLRDDDIEIRVEAARSLADLKENTSSYLKEGVFSKNPFVREGCADALGQQKFAPARSILETLTEDEEDKVRISAIHALEQIGDPKSAEIIVSRLADKETRQYGEKIWSAAIMALISLKNSDQLVERAYDSNRSVRWGILQALGILRTGIDVIITLLEDFDDQIRAQAAIASGQLKNTTAVKPLIKHLATDPNNTVRVNAAKALGEIGDIEAVFSLFESEEQKYVEVVTASSNALNVLGKTSEEKKLVNLLIQLKNKDEEIRDKSIYQLIEIDDSIKFLRQFLSATNHLLRASSALALGRAKDDKSAPKIRDLLSDKEILVRACSAEALGLLVDVDAVPLLITHLKNKKEDMMVRELCTNALASIGSPSVNMLVECLTGYEHKVVRRLSTQALEKIVDPESRKPLIDYGLRDKDEEVRQAAVRTLISIGEPVVKDIKLEDKKAYARMAAVRVLGEIGSVQAIRKLEIALNDGEALVREEAGNELEKIGLSAVKSLCRCLASPRKETARLAAKILFDLAPTMREEGEFHSIRFLRSALQKRDKEIQATACQALGILGDKNTTRDLVSMLGSKHENVRLAAVKSLGIMNDGRTIPPLELMLNDKIVEVRIAATEALEELDKQGIEAQVVEELIDYVKKPSGIKRALSQAMAGKSGTLMETLSSDIEEIGLEGVLAKGAELTSEAAKKESITPLKQLEIPMEKLQQLEKLRSQAILKEEEFIKGRESAIKDIIEIVENFALSDMSSEEIGTVLQQLTELNSSGFLPAEDFEPLRSILVKELIS